MNYYFEDFTIENYKRLIKLALEKYNFITFDEIDSNKSSKMLWRHDIDFCVKSSLKLAQIEAKMGVKTNYFVLLHSKFYNVFEKEITQMIYKIKDLGHYIGLHFDTHYYEIKSEKKLEYFLRKEAELFYNIFGLEIKSFSFHNNSEFTKSCNKEVYGDLFNVYTDKIIKNYDYCSDSNGYWKYRRLKDFLLDDKIINAQVLTHANWWQDEVLSPSEKINKVILNRNEEVLSNYETLLNQFGNSNISLTDK